MIRRTLVLNPWKFRYDEEVELYWLCSTRMDQNQNWMITAVFKRADGTVKDIEYPLGTLDMLRIGWKYKNGRISEDAQVGKVKDVTVPKTCTYNIVDGFKMPKKLYLLNGNTRYGRQKICHFFLNSMNYYVPCIEIMRGFLTPSVALTNAIMRPHGLESLIDSTQILFRELNITLSAEYPSRLVNDESVLHLVWLLYNKRAKEIWNSVYRLILNYSTNSYNSKEILIDTIPPMDKDCRLEYRGFNVDNSTFIQEVISIQGIEMPTFDSIVYSHPSLYKNEQVNEPKRQIGNKGSTEKSDELELDESGEPSRKSNQQSAVELPPVQFGFVNKPKMIKKKNKVSLVRTGGSEDNNQTNGSGRSSGISEKIVTTQDWSLSGCITPIEFKLLELVKEEPMRGLEKFFKAIDYITKQSPSLKLASSVVYLPYGKGFSVCPDGFRRTCAIVKVINYLQPPSYIFEVGRPDDWSVSTLFMYPLNIKNIDKDIEETIINNLVKLVNNNGHWDYSFLRDQPAITFDTTKHVFGQLEERWAERIMDKIC